MAEVVKELMTKELMTKGRFSAALGNDWGCSLELFVAPPDSST